MQRALGAGRGVTRIEVAVKALIVRRGRVLLLRRSAAATLCPDEWDTPGGRLRIGEDWIAALEREAREELGPAVTLTVAQILNAWTFRKARGVHLVGVTFLCTLRGRPVINEGEHSGIEWVAVSRALADPAASPSLRESLAAYVHLRQRS